MNVLSLKKIINPRFLSNTYIIVNRQTSEAIIIDPGQEEIKDIEFELLNSANRVPYIILTHEHFDHVTGTDLVRDRYKSTVLCSKICSERIIHPKKNLSYYGLGRDIIVAPPHLSCQDINMMLDWHGRKIVFTETPGHTSGSICIAIDDWLFTGDTILNDIATPCNLPSGDRSALKNSVDMLLQKYNKSMEVNPGHGEPFPLSEINYEQVLKRKVV
ncbi:MAG: MBL fold metallo-hydrolase [Smithellaceae bacterium]